MWWDFLQSNIPEIPPELVPHVQHVGVRTLRSGGWMRCSTRMCHPPFCSWAVKTNYDNTKYINIPRWSRWLTIWQVITTNTMWRFHLMSVGHDQVITTGTMMPWWISPVNTFRPYSFCHQFWRGCLRYVYCTSSSGSNYWVVKCDTNQSTVGMTRSITAG